MIRPVATIPPRIFTRPVLVVAAVALAVCLVFFVARLKNFQWDPSYFILACEAMIVPGQTPPEALSIMPGTACYDGIAFYRLALDPFTTVDQDFGLHLDGPFYRQQRILYPFLVWLFSGGGAPSVALWGMLGVNLLAAVALCAGGAALLQTWRRWPYWGCMLFVPGAVLAMSRSCGEVVSVACLIWGLVWLSRQRFVWAGVFLSLAVLGRETSMVVPGALLGMAILTRLAGRRPLDSALAWATVIPIAVGILMQVVLWQVWGVMPMLGGGQNLGIPFGGFLTMLNNYYPPQNEIALYNLIQAGYLLLLFCSAAIAMFFIEVPGAEEVTNGVSLGFVAQVFLAISLTYLVWIEDWAFMRVLTEVMVLGTLLLAAATGRFISVLRVLVFAFQGYLVWYLVDRSSYVM